ncbi:pyridoxamine 5'-phosphate oxidase family protein [Algibacter luteus]|uniref:pyridoxamine 5'-phosphate oxidase family protein n=1 Tax=Algibacter luteus TaxID=1178825 RepID=UPI0025918CB1|nr:pyridoxamine 5'-phosphate oxidase family protein [Algibacter luteus]WJJ95770.1 pyridoxamine 5'-phosphate oxidase family protein [Algibacter luteus]
MIRNLSIEDCLAIIESNYIGHLAYVFGENPIVIPITYFYSKTEKFIICYSSAGQKIDAMRKKNLVSLSIDEIDSVNQWISVQVEGVYEELEGPDAKFYLHEFTQGIIQIMADKERKNVEFISQFSSKLEAEGIPIVFRINNLEISGKQRQ